MLIISATAAGKQLPSTEILLLHQPGKQYAKWTQVLIQSMIHLDPDCSSPSLPLLHWDVYLGERGLYNLLSWKVFFRSF